MSAPEPMESEANAFAMELLMPAAWILRDAAGIDIDDHVAVHKLAKRYGVSDQVMALRIGQIAMTPSPRPSCPYCGTTKELRQVHDGGGFTDPEYTCEACFTPSDTGPCFDDLPAASP